MCRIRPVTPDDLSALLTIKDDPTLHRDRLRQQGEGSAVYLGAFTDGGAAGFVLLSLENKAGVMPYTNNSRCADMIDLLVAEPLRGRGIGSKLARACEEACRERGVPYLGLDVNPEDNPAAKRLYEGLGYTAVGELHLDGVYRYVNKDGTPGEYEDWCIDMIKKL